MIQKIPNVKIDHLKNTTPISSDTSPLQKSYLNLNTPPKPLNSHTYLNLKTRFKNKSGSFMQKENQDEK